MRNSQFIFGAWVFCSLFLNAVIAQEPGKKAYEQNCKACHDLKKSAVGPSLIDIRKLYPKENVKQFLAWTNNPGKKRPEGMQMPAMAHLGDKTLTDIHQYILKLSKGVTVGNTRHNFSFKAPPKTFPYYKRGYMPFASPASIGIMFNWQFGLNWDAGKSRLGYAFVSKQNFFKGEKNKEALKQDIVFQETSENLWSFAKGHQVKFKGYRINNDLPEFVYSVNGINIQESFVATAEEDGFIRTFFVTGIEQNFFMDLSHEGDVEIKSSKGSIVNNRLLLTPDEGKQFSLTVRIAQ